MRVLVASEDPDVFDPELIAFLEGGCALIVGTVDATGAPHATRGWGLSVTDPHAAARLLVASDDERARADLVTGSRVAVTAADVRTLRSVQCKGRVTGTASASDEDVARAGRYIDAFFTDIVETDGTPRRVLERIIPVGYLAVGVELTELFDQTPGPRAGTAVGGAP